MKPGQTLILLPAEWHDYGRFKPLCCVDTLPFPAGTGHCWTAMVVTQDEIIRPDAGFIGYTYAFRNNPVRPTALPDWPRKSRLGQMTYLNRYVRQLSRVMVRPDCRGQGIASEIVRRTLLMMAVPYIECLTFTASIAAILQKCGFIDHGQTSGLHCDYWLYTRPMADDVIRPAEA